MNSLKSYENCIMIIHYSLQLKIKNYQLKISDRYNIPIGNVRKLVPNFFDEEKYVIHYENLKLYLRP